MAISVKLLQVVMSPAAGALILSATLFENTSVSHSTTEKCITTHFMIRLIVLLIVAMTLVFLVILSGIFYVFSEQKRKSTANTVPERPNPGLSQVQIVKDSSVSNKKPHGEPVKFNFNPQAPLTNDDLYNEGLEYYKHILKSTATVTSFSQYFETQEEKAAYFRMLEEMRQKGKDVSALNFFMLPNWHQFKINFVFPLNEKLL